MEYLRAQGASTAPQACPGGAKVSSDPIQCPECGSALVKGKTRVEPDGTEITDYYCPGCGGRFADMSIPVNAVVGGDAAG